MTETSLSQFVKFVGAIGFVGMIVFAVLSPFLLIIGISIIVVIWWERKMYAKKRAEILAIESADWSI